VGVRDGAVILCVLPFALRLCVVCVLGGGGADGDGTVDILHRGPPGGVSLLLTNSAGAGFGDMLPKASPSPCVCACVCFVFFLMLAYNLCGFVRSVDPLLLSASLLDVVSVWVAQCLVCCVLCVCCVTVSCVNVECATCR
jgi:hypothetical protein